MNLYYVCDDIILKDKMNFKVFNYYPKKESIDYEILKKEIEKELFKLFNKYF